MSKTNKLALLTVMLCFFAMGFVDLVGIASNYVKNDLHLSDSTANVFPSLVFFWFLIFSVPTGMLMNRIGRKNTVLISLVVTLLSLLLPIFGESYGLMLVSFSLLGIGNALMQTSLNPLVSTVMKGGNLASTLTFGQFVKAIASFMAPYIAIWGAQASIPAFGLGWRVLFPVYLIIGVLATLLLFSTSIEEEPIEGKPSLFAECFSLLGKPIVLLSFLGIMCHVGIRCWHEHHGSKDSDGTIQYVIKRCCLCNFTLFYLPYHRMSDRLIFPAGDEQQSVLHYLCFNDGTFNVRNGSGNVKSNSFCSDCPCRLWQQQCVLYGLRTCFAECA